mgnify:CR=1 FL=1
MKKDARQANKRINCTTKREEARRVGRPRRDKLLENSRANFQQIRERGVVRRYLVGGSADRSEGTGREHILDHIVSSHSP